jgi:hypothetical protein
MLEQNIKELEKKNPELAKKILAHTKVKDIEVFEAESKNFIISHKGVLLHSNEDPLREAKALWFKTVKNDLKSNDIQVVYGLGLGYLFKRAYVNAPSKILVYEPSIDILRFVFDNVDFVNEIADNRVYFANTKEEALTYFQAQYFPGDKVEVLFLPAYLNFGQDNLLNFSNSIYKIVKDKNIDQNTVLAFSKPTTLNLLKRVKDINKYIPVDSLKGKAEGKPAIVICAGPSLLDDIETIKKNQNKFIKIAIWPAVPLLLKNGIKPDFVTVVDSFDQTYKIEDCKEAFKDFNIVMESRADINIDTIETKNKFIYFPVVDRVSNEILNRIDKNTIQEYSPASSVAILGFELAKILGCKEILFSGLDLALTGNKAYADAAVEIEEEHPDEGKLTLRSKKRGYIVKTTTIKSADGKEVLSREDYLIFIREFERIAKENPEIKLINTALHGALIEGMEYKTITEAVEPLNSINTEEVLSLEKDLSLEQYKETAIKLLSETKAFYEENLSALDKAIAAENMLMKELKAENLDLDKFQKLFNENIEICSTARNLSTQDLFLSTYMQTEITEFINGYNKDSQITLGKLLNNLKIELNLFEKTKEAINILMGIIDEII